MRFTSTGKVAQFIGKNPASYDSLWKTYRTKQKMRDAAKVAYEIDCSITSFKQVMPELK